MTLSHQLKTQLSILKQTNEKNFKKELARKKYSSAAVNNIYKEYKISLVFLEWLSAQNYNETELENTLRYYFKIRWALIKKSPAAYIKNPSHPMNIACEQLAIALAKDDESIAEILMQTLKVKYYQTVDEDLITLTEEKKSRRLNYNKFILCHDEKSILPIRAWIDLQNANENTPYLFKPYLTGDDGSHQQRAPNANEVYGERDYAAYAAYCNTFVPTPLDLEDLENLKSYSPQMRAYIEGIEKWQQKSICNNNFAKSIEKLCQDCLDNGVSKHKKDRKGEAKEGAPHPDVYPLIREFLEKWFALDKKERERIGALTALGTRGTFNDYITVLRSTAAAEIDKNTDGKIPYLTEEENAKRITLNLHTCVEVNAHAISRIVNANSFNLVPLINDLKSSVQNPEENIDNAQSHRASDTQFSENLLAYSDCLHKQKIGTKTECFRLYHAADLIQDVESEFVDDKKFALSCAQELQDIPLALKYIEQADNLNYEDEHQRTPLHYAALYNQISLLDSLIKKVDINKKDENGYTALRFALEEKSRQVAIDLFMAGANYDDEQIDSLMDLAKNSFNQKLIIDILNKLSCEKVKNHIRKHLLLHCACEQGWESLVDYCVDIMGDEIDEGYADGRTPLYFAAWNNHLSILNKLIAKGANVNKQNFKDTPDESMFVLHLAVGKGHVQIVKALLAAGADVNSQNNRGKTALHFAYHSVCAASAKILFAMPGININAKDSNDQSPLEIAFSKKSTAMMLLFIKENAVFSQKLAKEILYCAINYNVPALAAPLINKMSDNDIVEIINQDEYLHDLCEAGMTEAVNACLLRENIDLHKNLLISQTPLHCAVRSRNVRTVQALLDDPRIDPDGNTKHSESPMHLAYELAYQSEYSYTMTTILSRFIAAGANFRLFNDAGMHLIKFAIDNRSEALLLALIDQGVDFNYQFYVGSYTWTILHAACNFGMLNVIQACLKSGGNVNVKNKLGETPLHFAARSGRSEVIDLLIANQAPAIEKTNSGMTLLHYATAATFDSADAADAFAKKIVQLGVDINGKDRNGNTALHMCIYYETCNLRFLQPLLTQEKIDINAKNNDEETPVDIAIKEKRWDALILLIENGAQFNIDILGYAIEYKRYTLIKACFRKMSFSDILNYPELHKVILLLGNETIFSVINIQDDPTKIQLIMTKVEVLTLSAQWIKTPDVRRKIQTHNATIQHLLSEIEISESKNSVTMGATNF